MILHIVHREINNPIFFLILLHETIILTIFLIIQCTTLDGIFYMIWFLFNVHNLQLHYKAEQIHIYSFLGEPHELHRI